VSGLLETLPASDVFTRVGAESRDAAFVGADARDVAVSLAVEAPAAADPVAAAPGAGDAVGRTVSGIATPVTTPPAGAAAGAPLPCSTGAQAARQSAAATEPISARVIIEGRKNARRTTT